MGKKCASCAKGMFGLSEINPKGCTQCFCFGRTDDCVQSPYSWTQVKDDLSVRMRKTTITFSFVQLVMPRRRDVKISRGDSQLRLANGLIVVPGTQGDVVVGVNQLFNVPIYW